jgi:hypothetical protein
MMSMRTALLCPLLVMAFVFAGQAQASPIQITIDTSLLAGASVDLAFDLTDGGPPANTVAISGFASDGTLGAASSIGDVSGTFPGVVTIGDSGGFNEYLQRITLGSTLAFSFDTTGNPAAPGSSPDGFALFFLDPTTGLPLFETSDPTGAGALFLYSIGEVNPLALYSSDAVTVQAASNAVPEPAIYALVIAALLAFAVQALLQNKLRRRMRA